MADLDSYLFFNGSCSQAMRFYERTLGAKLEMMMTVGQSPMASKVPSAHHDKILHARLTVNGRALMASDWMDERPYEPMHGFRLSLSVSELVEGRRVFDALADGGQVTMPLQKTFWAEGFGMLHDRFGTPWMVNIAAPST